MIVNRTRLPQKWCPFLSLKYKDIFLSAPESLGTTLLKWVACCGFKT